MCRLNSGSYRIEKTDLFDQSPNTRPVLCYAKVVSFTAHIFDFRILMLQDIMIR